MYIASCCVTCVHFGLVEPSWLSVSLHACVHACFFEMVDKCDQLSFELVCFTP